MGHKTISLNLFDPKSMNRAIRDLKRYRKELVDKCGKLVEKLTDEGVKVAKTKVVALGAIYTGELEESIIGYYSPGNHVGIVRAEAWYAVYVEYGTGIVGGGSPHPAPEGWVYDQNGNGDKGWYYLNDRDGKYHWTAGEPSRPFMYNTIRELEQLCGKIAKEVFG